MFNLNLLKNKPYYMNFNHKNMIYMPPIINLKFTYYDLFKKKFRLHILVWAISSRLFYAMLVIYIRELSETCDITVDTLICFSGESKSWW